MEEKQLNAELSDAEYRFEKAINSIQKIRACIGKSIFGQDNVIDLVLSAVFANSHALLVGMPGVAKTSLIIAIANALGRDFRRIQFTPDLMPADILGSEVLESAQDGKRAFRFVKGPIFTQILMADEINRASPRTQSALLEAMQERKITIAGQTYELPKPFCVLASQNPIEHEGAYPLPEAQLDRFLLQIDVPYPDIDAEKQILSKSDWQTHEFSSAGIETDDFDNIQTVCSQLPVSEKFLETVMKLIRALRPQTSEFDIVKECFEWGPSPRAGLAIIAASKARALIKGRAAPSIDDLHHVAIPSLIHRHSLNWNAQSKGLDFPKIYQEVLDRLGL